MINTVTLKDVARAAGVSPSTASLVLNGKGQLSQGVRDRVYEAARKLEYIKPVYIPSIAAKQSSHIAILIFEDYEKAFIWNFFRRIIIQLEAIISKERYYPVIIPVSLEQNTYDIFEKVVLSRAGGLFSIDYGNQILFRQLEDQGIPVVVINNSGFQRQFYSVCVDDFHGACEGARYLLDFGHRQLAYLEYHRPDMPSLIHDRFIGFKKALDEEQIIFPEERRIAVNLYNMDELAQALGNLFQQKEAPTAIFAHDDFLAAHIIVALKNMHLRIPEDVSLIAPGDTLDYDQPYIPQITTMRINNELMGKLAGEMILERLKNQSGELHGLKVNQQLVERGSCRRITREV
ncbi:transcriptional regulator, LacI family protein [Candidatus Vecturithrix granuli]|uniref:Transcriptional regulator, LacI family protein n=1 Tax=Vecturithrix granuli TaxID=1499967 RepID=A0A081C3B7_VECG1|nr:transcriptional regulator, LacI family protein [Candidatus Vecturithrix granuli]